MNAQMIITLAEYKLSGRPDIWLHAENYLDDGRPMIVEVAATMRTHAKQHMVSMEPAGTATTY